MTMVIWALALLLAAPGAARAASPAEALEDAFAAAAERAKPAVVNITTVEERSMPSSHRFLFGELGHPSQEPFRWRAEGTGSGVIVDPRGFVVTNEHVVRGASGIKIAVTGPDGRRRSLPGKLVAMEEALDLALVRIEAPGPFPWLGLAASSRTRVGQWVLAIGSPFDLEQTVTAGVVSAVRQSLEIEGKRYHSLVQTDAAINHGNSGGPLVDLRGEVVGVNTAIFSPSGASAGVGFAISADEVRDFLAPALAGRPARRGWLGVELVALDDVLRRRFALKASGGALVGVVSPDGPAAKAGLSRGDAIVSCEGRPVASPDELASRIRRSLPGETVRLGAERDGKRRDVKVKLGERPAAADGAGGQHRPGAPKEAAEPGAWHGASFEDSADGPRAARVAPDSPCFGSLLEGDIIMEVDRRAVKDLAALQAVLTGARLSEGVLFDVVRRGNPQWVTVQSSE